MRHRGISPDAISSNTLIKGFCKERVDEAFRVLKGMRRRGWSPNGYTYLMLIGLVLCKESLNSEMGLGLMRDIMIFGVEPSGVSCNYVLASLCKEGKVREARLVYGWMSKAGVAVELVSDTCFVGLLCRERMTVEARKPFHEMAEKGISPNVVPCHTLIHGFFVNGKLEEGLKVLYDMVKNGPIPNAKTFTIVVMELCEGGKLEEAIEVTKL